MDKDEIRKAYLNTDIEPSIKNLDKIITICEKFPTEGSDRFMNALSIRNWDLDEVKKLSEKLFEATQTLAKEKKRLDQYQKDFINSFATDHNKYFSTVELLMNRIRSYTSLLKTLLHKTCSNKRPTKLERNLFGIQRIAVLDASALATDEYQTSCIKITDPSIPEEIRTLYDEISSFFEDLNECVRLCKEILNVEANTRNNPELCKAYLDNYRKKAFEKLKNQIMLFSEDILIDLTNLNPAYKDYISSADDATFAQKNYHRHNSAVMDHFCLIQKMQAMYNHNLENDEIANWGTDPMLVKKIRYVCEHFDELLPDDFRQKAMGRYQYYFCRWVPQISIKKANDYFVKHYRGNWNTSKYAAVNAHAIEYLSKKDEVDAFESAIQLLLSKANKPEREEIIA